LAGKTLRAPAYEIVCNPKNLESKCNICEDEIKNVYWKSQKKLEVYCRICYNLKVHESKIKGGVLEKFRKQEMLQDFSRKRHCEFFHKHHNTKAAVSFVPQKELEKRIKQENFYQSLFKY
jgi:hypothetical protein